MDFKFMRSALALCALIALQTSLVLAECPGTEGRVGEKEIKDEAVRISLAPHTLMVETQLLSALDQFHGIKAQMCTAQAQPTAEFMEHFRQHRPEITHVVKSVRTHEGELRG